MSSGSPASFNNRSTEVHPEANRLEVKRRDGATEGFGFLDDLIARGARWKCVEFRQQQVDGRERGGGTFRHVDYMTPDAGLTSEEPIKRRAR